ncbi:MAG: CHAT domain-containing protein, partial [Candidatus Methanofastidiosia archaeon]
MDATLELEITREGPAYTITAESDLGKGTGSFGLDPSLNSKLYDIQDAVFNQENLSEEFIKTFGAHLFDMLFSDIKDLLHTCLDQADHVDIIVTMEDPLLHQLPWEMCYDNERNIFLGADPCCSFIRRDHTLKKDITPIDYPLKVLVIVASPMDLKETEYQPDPDEIEDIMEPVKKLEEEGLVHLDVLERASVNRIQDTLKEGYHIVHFVGHGFYDGETGYLLIEDSDRNQKELNGEQVAQLFAVNPPQVMILTACESAPLIPFLLSRKIPAVMAMQYTVLVNVAHGFLERFYSMLVKGDSVGKAVSTARSAVFLNEGIGSTGWFTPVLVSRVNEILPVNTKSPVVKPVKVERGFDMVPGLLGVQRFVGRRKDLWLVEKVLFEDNLKMAVITGIGGIGKTKLASRFYIKHKYKFKGVFARKMVDPDMGVEELLQMLDVFLVKNGDERLHNVLQELDLGLKLGVLCQCLEDGYLIILDNFETLLDEKKITDEGIEYLLNSIMSGDHGSKVLVTTRYGFEFRGGKGGGLIGHVDLKELRMQTAVQLLEKFGVKKYGIRMEIYEKIGGNPQFIEFFMNITKERPIKELLEDVTPVREKVGDWLLDELIGLLTTKEKDGLKMISVFRLNVFGSAFDVLGVSSVVDTLVYYSLVKVDEHYFMHQGVRDYVYGLFSEDERIKAHGKAAEYYGALFEKGKGDLEDIYELHYHLIESEQYEKAGELTIGLVEPFLRWGLWRKLKELLQRTVDTTDGEVKTAGLHNLGIVLQSFGEYDKAEKLYRESLDIAKKIGDTAGVARSLHQLGMIHQFKGEYDKAEKLYRESLDI